MAALNIDFSYDDNVKRNINSAKWMLSTRMDDYRGVKNKLSGTDSSTGNLTNANTYIQKKINSLQGKYDRLDAFHGKITAFNNAADNADKAVANRINKESKDFYKREGLPYGFFYTVGCVLSETIEWLKNTAENVIRTVWEITKTTWQTIKDIYKKYKYIIDVFVDFVVYVAAVVALAAAVSALTAAVSALTAATGGLAVPILGVVFATWGLAKATTNLVADSTAVYYYEKGDKEMYETMSDVTLKTLMKESGGDFGEYLYYGIDIAYTVFSFYKMGADIAKVAKGGGPKKDIIHSLVGTKRINAIKDPQGKVIFDGLEGIKKVDGIFKNISFGVKTVNNIMDSDNFGTAINKSVKVFKLTWDGKNDLVGAYKIEQKYNLTPFYSVRKLTNPVFSDPLSGVTNNLVAIGFKSALDAA